MIRSWRRPTAHERQVLAPLLDGKIHELTEVMDEVLVGVPDHRVLVSTYGLASRVRLKPEGRRWLGGEA